MNEFNNPYAFQRSPSNDDEYIQPSNKHIEAVTVPSQRYHHPASSLSSTSASSSSLSSFTNYPIPTYPINTTSTTMQHQDYYQQHQASWDDPSPSPLPPTLNYPQLVSRHRHRWSPESSHPYQPHHQTRKHENTDQVTTKERRHRKQPHELLSESQKKANHIASEQKRRQNIRIGFDQLIDIVPSLNHGNRSEALILQKSVDHIRHLIAMKNDLKNQVRDLQGTLGYTNYEEDSSEDDQQYSY